MSVVPITREISTKYWVSSDCKGESVKYDELTTELDN